jgi:FkbM family methyltransferase
MIKEKLMINVDYEYEIGRIKNNNFIEYGKICFNKDGSITKKFGNKWFSDNHFVTWKLRNFQLYILDNDKNITFIIDINYGYILLGKYLNLNQKIYLIINNSFLEKYNIFYKKIIREIIFNNSYGLLSGMNFYPDYIIDIGANIGIFTLLASYIFPNSTIIAIEPELNNFVQLKNHCVSWNIKCENKLLYNKDNELLNLNLNRGQNLGGHKLSTNIGPIQTITWRTLLNKYNITEKSSILLKFDCEGCEQYFIELLSEYSNIKYICGEIHYNFNDNIKKSTNAFSKYFDISKFKKEKTFNFIWTD